MFSTRRLRRSSKTLRGHGRSQRFAEATSKIAEEARRRKARYLHEQRGGIESHSAAEQKMRLGERNRRKRTATVGRVKKRSLETKNVRQVIISLDTQESDRYLDSGFQLAQLGGREDSLKGRKATGFTVASLPELCYGLHTSFESG
jgi:hypothetical protein